MNTLYNPQSKNKDALVREFVIRLNIFERIYSDLQKSSREYVEQNYLIIGQRGAGKTTLLQRILIAIEKDEQLNSWLIPISLSEEQYNIVELSDLWENIGGILEDYYDFEDITAKMQNQLAGKHYEEKMYEILADNLKKKERRIVLFIDNLGDLLKKFSERDIHRLREILMTGKYIQLIAASPVTLEYVTDYHQPLLDFFKTITLGGLTNEETRELLLKLGEENKELDQIQAIIENKPERIEVLRRLTGGVARTIVLLYNIFMDSQDGSAFKDLEAMLDQVTPLYKHIMDDLPTQQQKIMDAVAKAWDGVTVKDLKEGLRIESKIISAQLRQLEKNQLILKTDVKGTKNHVYQVKDRFFNIWYLMRYGRKHDKQRVDWLVRFFESWLDKDGMEKWVQKQINKLKNNVYNKRETELIRDTIYGCNFLLPYSTIREFEKSATFNIVQVQEPYIEADDKTIDEQMANSFMGANYKNVISLFNSIKKPNSGNCFVAGMSAIQMGDLEIAEYHFNEANRLIKNKKLLLFQNDIFLAVCRFAKGEVQEAIKIIEPILSWFNSANANIYISDKERYFLLDIKSNNFNRLAMSKLSVSSHVLYINLQCNNYLHSLRPILQEIKSYAPILGESILYSATLSLANAIQGNFETYFTFLDKNRGEIAYKYFVPQILELMLAYRQFNQLEKLFADKELEFKDRYKPIYYAYVVEKKDLMQIAKMGEELRETVNEIIADVNKLRELYVYPVLNGRVEE